MEIKGNTRPFDDPSQWIIRKGIPIFLAHKEITVDKDGKEYEEVFDKARLERIAAYNRDRETKFGPQSSIMLGHIPKRLPGEPPIKESDLGKVVGYHRNVRTAMVKLGDEEYLGLVADFWHMPEHYAEAMEHPFRSIELHQDDLINPIALIKRTPKLPVGIVTGDSQPEVRELAPKIYQLGGLTMHAYRYPDGRRVYQMEDDVDENEAPVMTDETPPPEETDGGIDNTMAHRILALLEQLCSYLKITETKPPEAKPDDFQAPAAMPSGTNTGVPPDMAASYSREEFDKLQKRLDDLGPLQTRLTAVEKENATYKKRIELLETEKDATKRLYQKSQREKTLRDLQDEHELVFDLKEELEDTADFDDTKFEKHTQKMVKCYAREGQSLIRTEEAPRRNGAAASKEKAQKAVEYASKHKCSFEDALAKV